MTTYEGEQTDMSEKSLTRQSRLAYGRSRDRNLRAALRRTLWSAVVRFLNDSNLPYCILGAAFREPDLAACDVDFVVRPDDFGAVPQLLCSAAASVGGKLVQAIDHEATATYFAIAIQQGAVVAFLHPDCTTDYRRQSRLWMSAEELLSGRRRVPGGYFRPAPDVEFEYYLTKQVLKRTVSSRQWEKLTALYQTADDLREALSWWRLANAAQIDQALRRDDWETFRNLVPHLHHELINSPDREGAPARAASFASDAARVLTRVTGPTGLFVQISDGTLDERAEMAHRLAKALAPAFRRSSVMVSSNPAKVVRALVESTLFVSPKEMIPFRTLYGGIDLRWRATLSPEKNFERALAGVLAYLSQRTMRRLELQSLPSQRLELNTLADTTVH